jgi:aspartate-semialdehyde dehydrogenase
MSDKLTVAVCGATGAVGREMLKTLYSRKFPATEVLAFASARSAGKKVPFGDGELTVQELKEDSFEGVDLAIFSAGGATSTKFAPCAARSGCVVVDNSAAWRMDERCPLVVPEVNPEDLDWHNGIIANPNCSTIQMLLPLAPLHAAFDIKRIVVSTYQSVTGTGQKAIVQMDAERAGAAWGTYPAVYPYPIDRNILPHIDAFLEDGYTKEEMKMVNETHKILRDDRIGVSATTVRVPVRGGHSESVNLEFNRPFTLEAVRDILSHTPGVVLQDDPAHNIYPMPLYAEGRDEVFVGRIRRDTSVESGLNLWCVSDNLRKGAATNAVQIAEVLLKQGFLAE